MHIVQAIFEDYQMSLYMFGFATFLDVMLLENFTEDYQIRHFKEQLFTGYDITEFEDLFQKKPVEWLVTTGVDGFLEPIEVRPDFDLSDEDFKAFADWYLCFCEKRELLGSTNHLLYICRKNI